MIITGGITLINAVAYWYVIVDIVCRCESLIVTLSRFLFPDSPTNAWFLTPDERVKAVQRIKVRLLTPCCRDVPSKVLPTRKIKPVSRTNISKWSSMFLLDCDGNAALTESFRFYEALLDPKTWLFAFFSALDNVPNSLTNQRQIIVSEFGFTNLQTTLLGCVDGFIEIVTIYTGVTLVSRLTNARAYVGAIWFIPNIVGVFLINLLPWDNKVGLLFAQWTTGMFILLFAAVDWSHGARKGIGTTGFVLSLSWLSSVTAGHTKRVTTNAIMLSAYCVGNAAAPFMWQAKYQPRYADMLRGK